MYSKCATKGSMSTDRGTNDAVLWDKIELLERPEYRLHGMKLTPTDVDDG